ncbi:MAG: SurA N-terminal domain-containing protein [Proteobacteria bacterium]|nr:SurA N-terminal domain-containing protein [Pseudomonadota bacterium]
MRRRTFGLWLGCALVAALGATGVARAQVVVIANGSPITELDIAQRSKLMAAGAHKAPSRQAVINELIDDRLKIAKGKYYGLEVSDKEVDNAFNNMAQRQHMSAAQFDQVLARSGISPSALKARLRAQLIWNQLVRGRFGTSLEVADADVANALRKADAAASVAGYVYTLYPVTVVVPSGSPPGVVDAKRREAENLRSRFVGCDAGVKLARGLRDVAVREPVTRTSADLPEQLRDVLAKLEVGRLSAPEATPQGWQMFAMCSKKETTADSPAKREMRDKLYNERFEAESKKFLEDIRRSAMIEYKR